MLRNKAIHPRNESRDRMEMDGVESLDRYLHHCHIGAFHFIGFAMPRILLRMPAHKHGRRLDTG